MTSVRGRPLGRPTTLEVLDLLIEPGRDRPLLVVLTHRPGVPVAFVRGTDISPP